MRSAVLRRLAVFPGDWTLDAAESVCAVEIPTAEVLDAVLRLVDKSLVQVDHGGGRYRLLETIRLYAREKLDQSGELERTARCHYDWYIGFLELGSSQAGGTGQQQWYLRLEREQANYRGALDWAVESGWAEGGARLALALYGFWSTRAYHREADCWLTRIVMLPGSASLPRPLRARLLRALGIMAHTLNEFEQSTRYHSEALSIWREQGDAVGIATGLNDLAWLRFQAMDLVGARRYAEESLAQAREAGDPAAIATALHIFAIASVESGRLDGLVPALEESLGIWRALGSLPDVATALGTLARVEQRLGNPARAAGLMLEAVRLHTALGDYGNLIGHLVLMQGFEFDADGTVQEQPSQSGTYQPVAYLEVGRLLHGPMVAARVLGAMAAWQDKVIGVNAIQWDTLVVPMCEKLKAEMGQENFDREFSAARAMSVDEIAAFAEEYAGSVLDIYSARSPEKAGLPGVQVAAGGASAGVSHAAGSSHRSVGPDALTPREMEVLRLVADGLTNRQAAERLVVTPRTINAHLTSIYAKIGVTSRAAAVRFAMEHGLV